MEFFWIYKFFLPFFQKRLGRRAGSLPRLPSFEGIAGALDGRADGFLGSRAFDDEPFGGSAGLGRLHAGDILHSAAHGGFAVTAVHAFNGIDGSVGLLGLVTETIEKLHGKCDDNQ